MIEKRIMHPETSAILERFVIETRILETSILETSIPSIDSRDFRDSRETSSNESNYSANYMIEAISDPDLGRVEEERVKRFIELAAKQKITEFVDGIIGTNFALEHCVHYRKTYIIQKLFDCRNVDMKMKEKLAKHIINSQKDAVFY